MRRSLLVAGLIVSGLLLGVKSASADTLHFEVSGPLGTATFDLSQRPTVVPFTANDFLVNVTNGSANLLGSHFLVPPFRLEFSNSSAGGGLGVDTPLGDLQLTRWQMFTGSTSAPVLSRGTFHLADGTTVTVTSMPEPATILLLGSGHRSLVVP